MKHLENTKKITEKSWGHTYKSAHISIGIDLRLLNLVLNQRQANRFYMRPKCATLKHSAKEKLAVLYVRAFQFAIIFHSFIKFSL